MARIHVGAEGWCARRGRADVFGSLAGDLLVYGTSDADQSNFSRLDYSPCFGGSSYQTEMAITATLWFTGLPVC